jgi:molecular chaperone GrpE
MRKRKQQKREAVEAAELAEEAVSALEDAAEPGVDEQESAGTDPAAVEQAPEAAADEGLLAESPEVVAARLAEELEEQRDRYLRLAAEFDNFRKRMVRERSEISSRARAEVTSAILEGLDDLDRVSQLDPEQATSKDVIDGVELVERKLFRELELAGLQRVGIEGERFDPNHHEAVAATPAPDAEKEDLIAAVLQVGYRMGDMLLRPARVQVFVATDPAEGGEA